jgi:uncharacterized protein YkwD
VIKHDPCNNGPIRRLCKHACTLSGAVRRTRRKIGALIALALPIGVGELRTEAAVARAASASCPGANLHPGRRNAPAVHAATVCLIDRVRAVYHLRPLRSNRYLQGVATRQVKDMVRWNYFADDRPSGLTPSALIASTGYAARARSLSTGQNIGWATGADTTPASMVSAWMSSPPHRAIMLARHFLDIGVGVTAVLPSVLERGRRGATYAVEFAARGF